MVHKQSANGSPSPRPSFRLQIGGIGARPWHLLTYSFGLVLCILVLSILSCDFVLRRSYVSSSLSALH